VKPEHDEFLGQYETKEAGTDRTSRTAGFSESLYCLPLSSKSICRLMAS
jgi:hypothetical protein